MTDSGESFFRANKQTRNDAFSFKNQEGLDQEVAGDQSARLHPIPAMLGTGQKVGNPLLEPSPESAALRAAGIPRQNMETSLTVDTLVMEDE